MDPDQLTLLQEKYFGAQDNHLKDNTIKSNYDAFHSTFQEKDYKVHKGVLSYTDVIRPLMEYRQAIQKNQGFCREYTFRRGNEFTEDVSIVIKKQKGIEYQLCELELSIGKQRIVRLHDATQVNVFNSLYGKKIIEDEETMVIPCPFINISMFKFTHHEVQLYFSMFYKKKNESDSCIEPEIEIHGTNYYLNIDQFLRLVKEPSYWAEQNRIIQSQCVLERNSKREHPIQKGINRIHLRYNHPIFLIYFYGIDKSKIKNIKLTFGTYAKDSSERIEDVVYDSSVSLRFTPGNLSCGKESTFHSDSALVHGLIDQEGFDGNNDATFLYFSNKFNFDDLYANETINFSRVYEPVLVIDTEQEIGVLCTVGLNYGIGRTMSGMYGLAFSK
jgi:hypothetical protein